MMVDLVLAALDSAFSRSSSWRCCSWNKLESAASNSPTSVCRDRTLKKAIGSEKLKTFIYENCRKSSYFWAFRNKDDIMTKLFLGISQ